jgi:hypothetical protein
MESARGKKLDGELGVRMDAALGRVTITMQKITLPVIGVIGE